MCPGQDLALSWHWTTVHFLCHFQGWRRGQHNRRPRAAFMPLVCGCFLETRVFVHKAFSETFQDNMCMVRAVLTCCCFYIFGRQRGPSTGSLPKFLRQQGLIQATARNRECSLALHEGYSDSNARHHLLPLKAQLQEAGIPIGSASSAWTQPCQHRLWAPQAATSPLYHMRDPWMIVMDSSSLLGLSLVPKCSSVNVFLVSWTLCKVVPLETNDSMSRAILMYYETNRY